MIRIACIVVLLLLTSERVTPVTGACADTLQPKQVSGRMYGGTRLDVDINGVLTVVDGERNVVRQYSRDLVLLKEIGGSGWSNDQFDKPAGVWARNGIDIFVADYGNHRIQRFDRQLTFISSLLTRDCENPDERFGYPTDVALSRLGDLFICDTENSRVVKVSGLSKVERTFGGFGAGKGRLQKPNQLDIGPNDNVYVQDGRRIVVFDNFGNYVQAIEGLFEQDPLVYADEKGLVALDGKRFYMFDENVMPVATVELDTTLVRGTPRAFALGRGVAFVLTADGITCIPDPRTTIEK
ncbi:MAG: hypothetical protein C4326_15025 [Ignavibacteria bacterium]